MAQISTMFNVCDKVVTLNKDTMKMTEITIGYVSASINKDGKPSVRYSPLKDSGDVDYCTSYEENVCFATKDQLLDYIFK
jgi:hypothetical protein